MAALRQPPCSAIRPSTASAPLVQAPRVICAAGVATRDVGDLVGEHASHLRVIVGDLQDAAIDPDRSARQGEGIHLPCIGRTEAVRIRSTTRVWHESSAEVLHVAPNHGVPHFGHVASDLHLRVTAQLNLIGHRDELDGGQAHRPDDHQHGQRGERGAEMGLEVAMPAGLQANCHGRAAADVPFG